MNCMCLLTHAGLEAWSVAQKFCVYFDGEAIFIAGGDVQNYSAKMEPSSRKVDGQMFSLSLALIGFFKCSGKSGAFY